MKRIKIYSIALLFFGNVAAQIGCMDNSKHTYTKDGYDYKTLHPVACSCPCQTQRHLARKGKCFKCRHYFKDDAVAFDMSFLYTENNDSLFGSMRPARYY